MAFVCCVQNLRLKASGGDITFGKSRITYLKPLDPKDRGAYWEFINPLCSGCGRRCCDMQPTRTCNGRGSVTQWEVKRYNVQWEQRDGGKIEITDVYSKYQKSLVHMTMPMSLCLLLYLHLHIYKYVYIYTNICICNTLGEDMSISISMSTAFSHIYVYMILPMYIWFIHSIALWSMFWLKITYYIYVATRYVFIEHWQCKQF